MPTKIRIYNRFTTPLKTHDNRRQVQAPATCFPPETRAVRDVQCQPDNPSARAAELLARDGLSSGYGRGSAPPYSITGTMQNLNVISSIHGNTDKTRI